MEIEMHRCPICRYDFEWKFQMDHHVRREQTNDHTTKLFHATVEPEHFSCTCCGFRTYYNWDLYKHFKRQHHGRNDENYIEQSTFCDKDADKYRCNLCHYKSDSSLCRLKHTDSCEMMMKSPTSVDNADGTSTSRSNVGALGKKAKDIHCTECSYKTKWKDALKMHMLRHAPAGNINWFQCVKCSYKAKQKAHLQTHMLTHASREDIDWLQCPKCSHKAKRKTHLKAHMLTHAPRMDIVWFQCAECTYKAKQKSHLKRHMLIHTSSENVDWFQCVKCSFKSKRRYYLTQHVRHQHASSDEIDWFQCTKCSYKAKQKSNLKTHMLTHASGEDIDWFQCAECSYKTRQKSRLKEHMLTHVSSEDEAWFQCA